MTVKHFAATANMITPRAHFNQIGLFNPVYYSGGDQEWGLRLQSNRIPVVYAADVIVEHPARVTLGQVIRKNRRGVGADLAEAKINKALPLRILLAQFRLCKSRALLLRTVVVSGVYGRIDAAKIVLLFLTVHLVRWSEALRLIIGGRPLRS